MAIERYYKIHDAVEYDSINWDITFTGKDTCRWSIDRSKFIVNYNRMPDGDSMNNDEITQYIESNYWDWNEDSTPK